MSASSHAFSSLFLIVYLFDPKCATPVADMASLRNATHIYVTYWNVWKPAAVLGGM